MTTITVPGEPVAKGRPRMTKRGHVYTPAKTEEYESRVALAYRTAQGRFYEGPVAVGISAYLKPPKSLTRARRALIEQSREYPTKVPDIDNLAKCVLDGLSGVAYANDKQVVRLHVEKRWAQPGQDGYVDIIIKGID